MGPFGWKGLICLPPTFCFSTSRADIRNFYPNKFIQRDDTKRFRILNTLFNLTGECREWALQGSSKGCAQLGRNT